jgi:hypothetical protein
VRPVRAGGKLWHKKGGKKEAVIGQLDYADFSSSIYPCDFACALAELIAIRWVETVVTAELLHYCLCPIRLMGQRAWRKVDLLRDAHERARQCADDQA